MDRLKAIQQYLKKKSTAEYLLVGNYQNQSLGTKQHNTNCLLSEGYKLRLRTG